MSIKISLYKSTGDGEQLNQEFNLEPRHYAEINNGKRLREIFAPYFRMADDRLLEMNLRIMFANRAVNNLPPESQVAFHQVMDMLHGQRPSEPKYAEMLQKAINETTQSLVEQGISREKIDQAVKDSYGIGSEEPNPAEATE